MAEKWAVVLGGGGARGAYEIGVWKAIRELGIEYNVITGTSVGALNGALMVHNDFDAAYDIWSTMSNSTVIMDMPSLSADSNIIEFLRAFAGVMIKNGAVDVSPLERLIGSFLDEKILRSSPVDFGIVTVKIPKMQENVVFIKEISKGRIKDYLMASASYFPAFPPHKIGDSYFIDGGYANNVPIDLAFKSKNRFDKMLIVNLETVGIVRWLEPNCPYIYLRSAVDLGNMLIFDGNRAKRNIKLGYFDTLKVFEKLAGGIYTFEIDAYKMLENTLKYAISALPENLSDLLYDCIDKKLSDIVETRLKNTYTHMPSTLQFVLELTAEFFEVPYDVVYTSESFFYKLGCVVSDSKVLYSDVSEHMSIVAIAEIFKKGGINRKTAIMVMARFIREKLDSSEDDIHIGYSFMPMELASAILLLALKIL